MRRLFCIAQWLLSAITRVLIRQRQREGVDTHEGEGNVTEAEKDMEMLAWMVE